MKDKVFISVILPLKLEWEPCYALEGDCEGVAEGDRIKVDFAGRKYVGVVSGVGIEPEMDLSRIKTVKMDGTGMQRVLPEEIALWRNVADYYMCTVGEVFKAAYPAVKTNMEEALANARQKNAIRTRKQIVSLEVRLARIRESIARKTDQLSRARKDESRERFASEKEKAERAALEVERMLNLLKEGACDNVARATSTGGSIVLTADQEAAAREIREGFDMGKPVMLHGVTGSGKTEIYIKLAAETLNTGRNVLYLVPEIALSRQLEDRLRVHFPDELLVFHSGESPARKRDTAEIVRSSYGKQSTSKGYILLGTRSSLFLPHHDLGLIIIDEEHDTSYKQDSPAPRYNGRDTALMMSRIQSEMMYRETGDERCNVLLGSATPSLEEIYNCRVGRHKMVRLSVRYHGAEDSEVEIIDTKAERRKRGMVGSISRKLIGQMSRVLEAGGQILILRSRRAWSSSLQCSVCGDIQKCPHCNVSLSLHMGHDNNGGTSGRMTCHYCGWSAPYTGKCTRCGGTLDAIGAGTQKIEEEISAIFPRARIDRLDSDSAQDKSSELRIIKDFSEGRTDILVGTQIVTKGFDFSNLRMVAVIAADSLLGIQDFRADEKAMQTLGQFRGRCGRREAKGKIVIQTSQPQHPVYQRIANGENESFTDTLLAERMEFGFPPYSRIVELQIKDRYEDRAVRMADTLTHILRSAFSPIYGKAADTVTGPYTPMPDKVADNYLRMIRICLPKDRNLKKGKAVLKEALTGFEKDMGYEGHVTVNVDPS